MAPSTRQGGIQQLFAAEQEAQHTVYNARNETSKELLAQPSKPSIIETSKELLAQPSKPSIIESILLRRNDSAQESHGKNNLSSGYKKGGVFTTEVPKSPVLGKVKDFLGVMSEANQKLELNAQGTSRHNYDIEVLSDDEEEYIAMDLLLGIADLQTPEAVAAAEAAVRGFQPLVTSISSSSCSDAEEDTNSDSGHASTKDYSGKTDLKNRGLHENKRGNGSNKRPKIVVLN